MIEAIRTEEIQAEGCSEAGDFLVLYRFLEERKMDEANAYIDRFKNDPVFTRRAHTMKFVHENFPVYERTSKRRS